MISGAAKYLTPLRSVAKSCHFTPPVLAGVHPPLHHCELKMVGVARSLNS